MINNNLNNRKNDKICIEFVILDFIKIYLVEYEDMILIYILK
jgi:hypothetical protein